MLGSVTQACRTLLSGDGKYGFRCRGVPFILTSFCLAPFGNENGLKCCLKVSYCTLGRRKCSEVSPKRAVLYTRATNGVGFVAEESTSSLRHSVLHLWASIMDRSVTQACRAALLGDENVRKCCLSVSRCTLGRRKCTKVLPKRAALHPRATKKRGIVAQACRATPSGDGKCGFRCQGVPFILTSFCPTPTGNKNGRKCRLNVSCRTLGRRRSAEVSLKRVVPHSWVTILG